MEGELPNMGSEQALSLSDNVNKIISIGSQAIMTTFYDNS